MVASPAQLGVTAGASASDALEFRGVLATVNAASCPGRLNFHMHTQQSDGQLAPEAVIDQAIHIGLEELAITDHHTVNGYYRAAQYLEDWQWKHPAPIRASGKRKVGRSLPRLWTGVEITARLAEVDVHILGYAFQPGHAAMQPYLSGHSPRGQEQEAAVVIRAIQAAGGLAVLAHPCRYRRSPDELVPVAVEYGLDGLEAYYAYDNPKEWRPCPKKTPSMEQLAAQFGLLSTCGTDTHGGTLTRRL